MDLRLGELSHQFKYQINDYLIVTLCTVIQFVWEISEESFKAAHESIDIATAQFLDKLTHIKTSLFICYRRIERHQEVEKTIAYFIVRKT